MLKESKFAQGRKLYRKLESVAVGRDIILYPVIMVAVLTRRRRVKIREA